MKLSSKQRKSLPDSDFGLITDSGERKYPMHDKRHVILAIRMFKHCPAGKEKELAGKINKKIKEFGIKLNPASTGAFTKYATSEAFSLSGEATNVGTLEPIVGGSEVVRPMSHTEIDTLEAPIGMKELMKLMNEKTSPTEEAFVEPRVIRITKFQADHARPIDKNSVFRDFERRVDDIIALGEYNDALKYTLDKGTVYGVDSWFYKDQIVDIYNNDADDDMKSTELAFLVSTTSGDERKYLLAVIYRLDCTNGGGLLDQVINKLNEFKDKPFASFYTPNAPDISFGPFDMENAKYDYPESFRFGDSFEIDKVVTRYSVQETLNKLCDKEGVTPAVLNPYTARMMCAEMVNAKIINGYKCIENQVYEDEPTYMVVRKNGPYGEAYGLSVFEAPYFITFWYKKEDFFNAMSIITRYEDRYPNFDVTERCYVDYYNVKKDYENVSIQSILDIESELNDMLRTSVEDIFRFGIDAYKENRIDDMKDAAATLFTACRFFELDGDVGSSVTNNCNFKCKNLIKKIYAVEASFNFLKFYNENGYDFYTTDQNVMGSKLAYSKIMGI